MATVGDDTGGMAKRIIIILVGVFGFYVFTKLNGRAYLLGVADTVKAYEKPDDPYAGCDHEGEAAEPFSFNHTVPFNHTPVGEFNRAWKR